MSLPLAISAEKNDRVLRSSNIELYDGITPRDFSISASPTLNEVFKGIDNSLVQIRNIANNKEVSAIDSDILYSGAVAFSCFNITASSSIAVAIEEIATQVCVVSSSLSLLNASGVLLDDDNTELSCLSLEIPAGSTQTDLNNRLIYHSCLNASNLDAAGFNRSIKESMDFMTSQRDVVISGGDIVTSVSSLSVEFSNPAYMIINGQYVSAFSEGLVLTPSRDNYIYAVPVGTKSETANVSIQSVTIGAPAPTLDGIIYKIETDAVGAVSTTDLRDSDVIVSSSIADLSITTAKIADTAVSSTKMDTITTAATVGDLGFFSITYNKQGRVSIAEARINITGLANGDILTYDAGAVKWVNTPLGATSLPSASINETIYYDGGVYQSASNLINTGNWIGIGHVGGSTPTTSLSLHNTATLGHQLQTPTSVSSSVGFDAGSSLGANTYYYTIIAVDGSGQTVNSTETSITINGVTENQVTVSWALVPLASGYRVLRGTSAGVYTVEFSSNRQQFIDTGAAGSGVGTVVTNTTAYGMKMRSSGLAIGDSALNYPLSICVGNGDDNVNQMIISNCYGGITTKGNAGILFRPSDTGDYSTRVYSTFDGTGTSDVRMTFGVGYNSITDILTLKYGRAMVGEIVAGNTPSAKLQVIGSASHQPLRVDSATDADILWAKTDGDVSLSVGDLRIETKAKGIVMIDRTSNVEYRVYIDSTGTVLTETV